MLMKTMTDLKAIDSKQNRIMKRLKSLTFFPRGCGVGAESKRRRWLAPRVLLRGLLNHYYVEEFYSVPDTHDYSAIASAQNRWEIYIDGQGVEKYDSGNSG